MADTPTTTEASNDLPAHQRDYSGFVRLLTYGAVISFIIALVVMFIISN